MLAKPITPHGRPTTDGQITTAQFIAQACQNGILRDEVRAYRERLLPAPYPCANCTIYIYTPATWAAFVPQGVIVNTTQLASSRFPNLCVACATRRGSHEQQQLHPAHHH